MFTYFLSLGATKFECNSNQMSQSKTEHQGLKKELQKQVNFLFLFIAAVDFYGGKHYNSFFQKQTANLIAKVGCLFLEKSYSLSTVLLSSP